MISTINEAVVTLSNSTELSLLFKATVMLLVGLTVVRLAVRSRASVRHLLLSATFATVLALPLIVLTAPEVLVRVPAVQSAVPSNTEVTAEVTAVTQAVSTSTSNHETNPPSRVTQSATWFAQSWTAIARLVWIVGVTLVLLRLAVDLRRLYRIRRDSLPWPEQRELVQSLAADCGIQRSVEVLLHEEILAPLTYGIWRPAILFPSEAREWNQADLRRAIVHELEHIRRADWAVQLMARAICAFYWFHPLVWVAFKWLSVEAERASDDAVVRSAESTEYAEQLVLLAGRLSKAHSQPALGLANSNALSTRVSALLDGSQRRGRASLMMAASALGVAVLVVVAIAPVRAVALSRKQTIAPAQESGPRIRPTKERISLALDRAVVEAAADGDVEAIDELLRAGANVNCSTDGDGSPLIRAAREGRFDAVRLLLDRGAD